jgi:hypothetical protein
MAANTSVMTGYRTAIALAHDFRGLQIGGAITYYRIIRSPVMRAIRALAAKALAVLA